MPSTQNQQYVNSDASLRQRSPSQNVLGYDNANYGHLSPGAGLKGSEEFMASSRFRYDVGLKILSSAGSEPSHPLGTANTLLALPA